MSLPKYISIRGERYVQAGQFSGPFSGGDTSKLQKAVLKLLKELELRHYNSAKEMENALQKNPKDSISYRNWREHQRFVRLFKALEKKVADPGKAASMDEYLKAMKDTNGFSDHWEGLKEHGLEDVEAIPDDARWPAAEKFTDVPLGVIPSQNLTRPRTIR